MLLLRPPRPDRASTAWRCPESPRPRLPPGSGTLRPGRPERPWRVWPGQPRACRPWGRAPAPPPPPGTSGSPSHAGTPEPAPPPRPTHQPPPAPPHHDAHPDQPQNQTQNTPPTSGASTTRPHPPDRVECPRQCWWQGRRWWADDDAAVRRWCWAHAAPELTSRPPRRQFPPIPRESQEDIEAAGAPAEAGSATPSRTRPNGAPWCGRQPLSVSRTRRGALSAPDLPDITQVTARNRLKMPQIPRRDL